MAGFNLVELIITLTIAGVLAALAAPSFRSFMASQRIKTASFDLVVALTQTRSEAVKRNANVVMTASGNDWKNGWTITSGATTLGSKSSYKNVSIVESANQVAVTFRGDGRITNAASVKLTISPSPAVSGVSSRCVSLALSGQASSAVGSCS